jgi:hypothetical protein
MTDVFLSYSRADQDFVRRLMEALQAAGRGSWVDWEGIAPTAEWMIGIREAIDVADTFVFVMSPDSLSSRVCGEELEHAVEAHKRIVPLMHREADEVPVPESLAKRNWLFFRDSDDFDQAFSALLEAIDTDLEHIKFHTRLLVRAREWSEAGESRTGLLRGADLAEAERRASSPDRTLPAWDRGSASANRSRASGTGSTASPTPRPAICWRPAARTARSSCSPSWRGPPTSGSCPNASARWRRAT